MRNKQFAITTFSIAFGITCFILAVLTIVISKDLSNKVNILENEKSRLKQEITGLEWQLENNYMYCTNE